MRIGIDVRYLSHGLVGGVHTYVRHFVPSVIALADDVEFILYADTKRPFELEQLPARVAIRLLPWRGPLSSLQHDLLMHRLMAQDRIDLAHFPANYGFGPAAARTVITLHDSINVLPLREIWRGHPKHPRTIALMTYLHLLTTRALRRADLLLTVSQYARQDIAARTGFDIQRIVAIPHAPTPDLRRVEDPAARDAIRRRLGIVGPFLLADALKNPTTVVRAWKLLPPALRQNRQIVFFSRRPDPPAVVTEAVAAGQARLLVRPARDDLIALYSMAEAFVFPSWIEGFGIPLLEAMTCGAPVIASDRGAIPEVAGDAALLAAADDADGIARHLAAVLTNPELAAYLRLRGFARAAQFSWERTARQILEVYQRLLDKPAGCNRLKGEQ
ncbi:MAG: glycosyltransferase family 4 protein [Chloroflexi bacterium]|nr:glycosyltransferase family 4 protein [Chloroflexota bacterium]